MTKCECPYCREDADEIYYGHQVCDICFNKHCNGVIDLKKIFGVKE